MCTRAFVMLFFLSGAHLRPDPKIVLRGNGNSYHHPYGLSFDYAILYRVSPNEDLLVVNCSQPETLMQGYDVRCAKYGFMAMNLSVGQSGVYRYEEWMGGNITANGSFHLTVCEENEWTEISTFAYSGVLCGSDSALGNGTSIQVYCSHYGNPTLVLDTNLHQEDLRGQLQVDLNASLVRYLELNDELNEFYCTLWKEAECQTLIRKSLDITPKDIFGHEKENLTLPCVLRGEVPGQVNWSTPTVDVRLSNNQTLQQEVMYMLNGSDTGNYSLIIPSLSQQHSGMYTCKGHNRRRAFSLFFCKTVFPLNLMFSHGERIQLDVSVDNQSFLFEGPLLQWYRQTVLQPQVLIVDSWNKSVVIPGDLRGRVTVDSSNYSLLISNLTAEDSGVYTWRYSTFVYEDCFERKLHLVYRDPFGVHTSFYRVYRSLLGSVLLGLVAAVVWLKLRSRGVALTSSGQEMEMQDIGDEDVYDDVEEAEEIV